MIRSIKEEVVEPEDVLLAMSQNLVETHALYKVPQMDDPPIYTKGTIKPPKEVFYRKTTTFATQVPPAPQPRRCSCQFLCTGARAEVKCMTCSLYDVTGNGYYCQACFTHRHPWFRAPHVWTVIEKDESIEYMLSIQNRKAEALRYAQEGMDLMEKLDSYQKQLDYVGDDIKIDKEIFNAGRNAQSMEERLIEMRHKLRDDLRFGYGHSEGKVNFDDTEASIFIQRCWRGYMSRKAVSLLYVERFYRVYDHHAGKEYYHDESRGVSTWELPRFLLYMHYELMRTVEDHSVIPYWACKRFCKRRREHQVTSPQTAAKIICCFFRCIMARKKIIRTGNEVYRRVWDDEHHQYFYANLLTSESIWIRPMLFLLAEPPAHMDEEYMEAYHSARSAYNSARGTARGSARSKKAQTARAPFTTPRNEPRGFQSARK